MNLKSHSTAARKKEKKKGCQGSFLPPFFNVLKSLSPVQERMKNKKKNYQF